LLILVPLVNTMSKTTFGYWKVKGMGATIRVILHYVGEEHEEKLYGLSPDLENMREEWLKEKFTLGLDFPNLPYYIDGDLKLTQSNAIIHYLGIKYKLNGKTPKEQATVAMIQGEIYDLRMSIAKVVYNPDYANLRPGLIDSLKTKLKDLDAFIAGKKFLLGDDITVADFNLYDILDNLTVFEAGLVESFDNLKNLKQNVESIPNVAAYNKRSDLINWPIFGPYAHWGGSGSRPSV